MATLALLFDRPQWPLLADPEDCERLFAGYVSNCLRVYILGDEKDHLCHVGYINLIPDIFIFLAQKSDIRSRCRDADAEVSFYLERSKDRWFFGIEIDFKDEGPVEVYPLWYYTNGTLPGWLEHVRQKVH